MESPKRYNSGTKPHNLHANQTEPKRICQETYCYKTPVLTKPLPIPLYLSLSVIKRKKEKDKKRRRKTSADFHR